MRKRKARVEPAGPDACMKTSFYEPRSMTAGLYRCDRCRHRFEEVPDFEAYAWRIVRPAGKIMLDRACNVCRRRFALLGIVRDGVMQDGGVRLAGVNA